MKKTLLALLVFTVVLVVFSACKRSKATSYFINHYAYSCAVQVFEGELTDFTGHTPVVGFYGRPGKTLVQDDVKFPKVCTIRFFLGDSISEKGAIPTNPTYMKALTPFVNENLSGQAVVTFTVNADGTYGVDCSNM